MKINHLIPGLLLFFAAACSSGNQPAAESAKETPKAEAVASTDPMQNKGIGSVKHVELGATIDQQLAAQGQAIYDIKCKACHKPTERFIGPAQKGVLDRRTPEWVMNMIMNPEVMIKEDPIAKALLLEYNMAPMANQGISEAEARALVEYFRTL